MRTARLTPTQWAPEGCRSAFDQLRNVLGSWTSETGSVGCVRLYYTVNPLLQMLLCLWVEVVSPPAADVRPPSPEDPLQPG